MASSADVSPPPPPPPPPSATLPATDAAAPASDAATAATHVAADADQGSVPRLSPEEATEVVLRSFLEANRPFIVTGATARWRAAREWVAPGEEGGLLSLDRLVGALGGADVRVPVVECGGRGGKYGEEPRREMSLGEYATLWGAGEAAARGLYLKDFHFVLRWREQQKQQQQQKGEQEPPCYTVPPPLDDDWLNAWWDSINPDRRDDDYRFLYLGPPGSATPLHHDVLCSYSWSANLAGRKRWRLFHPRHTAPLLAAAHADSSPAAERLPAEMSCLEVGQGPGELLFVPSGWYHQVTNLTGCLSLNHNWFNGSSLGRVWAFLKEEHIAVRSRLEHLRGTFDGEGAEAGWARQCEVVLRANAAMNLTDFARLLVGRIKNLVVLAEEKKTPRGQQQEQQQQQQQQQWRRDVGRVVAVLKEVRAGPCLLDSLFPSHLEAQLRPPSPTPSSNEGEDVWPPPPPPPLEVMRPLVAAWLDEAIAAGEAVLVSAEEVV